MIAPYDSPPRVGIFLPPHPFALALCAALVGYTAARLAARHERVRDQALAFGVWSCALVVLYTQLLSAITQLHWPGLLLLSGAGACLALLRGRRQGERPGVPLTRRILAVAREEHWAIAVLLLPVAAYALWETWLVLVAAETCGDNVAYHLPRLGYWLQRQSVAPFPSNDPRSGTFPPNGNILQLLPVLFLRTERLSPFAQLLAFLGTGGAIFAIGRELRASRLAAAAAACCWISIPTALGQAILSTVDVIAAFFVAATVAFAVAGVSRPGASTWTCLAAAALAVGTKTQVVLLAFPAAALALGAAWRSGRRPTWRHVAGAVALAYLLAGVGLVQNLLRFGSPYGYESVAWVVGAPGWRTFALNLQLLLAPLNPVPWLISPVGRVEKWSLPGALSGLGLGLLWVVAMIGALARFAWRAARRRPAPSSFEALYLAGAAAFMASTLFVMRHQPSVTRFALPAVAMLTPLMAPAFDVWLKRGGWRRVALAVTLAAASSWVMLVWAVADFKGRVRLGRPTLEFKPMAEMCDAPYTTLAHGFEDLGRDYGHPRVGIITGHYFYQRFFFGPRYENVVIPLCYAPGQDLALLDRLGLDAVWVDVTFATTELFRRPFTPPPRVAQPAEPWLFTSLDTFREGFIRSVQDAVEYRSYEPLVMRLARRGSGWGVSFADSWGVLFTRQRTTEDALAVMGITGPNGVRVVGDAVYTRLGDQPVYVTAFAGRPGVVAWEASFLPGAERLAWPRRRVVVRDGRSGRELSPPAGSETFSVPVRSGINYFMVLPRSTSDGAPADRRGRLAMGRLRLSWLE